MNIYVAAPLLALAALALPGEARIPSGNGYSAESSRPRPITRAERRARTRKKKQAKQARRRNHP